MAATNTSERNFIVTFLSREENSRKAERRAMGLPLFGIFITLLGELDLFLLLVALVHLNAEN